MRTNSQTWAAPAAARIAPSDPQSIDDLDAAIRNLALQMNLETYRMLVLVREFDERLGWQKWSTRSCAEWLAWRCDLSLSAAREKVRTAHALREMPAIAAAFADGRLSYSKVRALTRVVEYHDEETLLSYALTVSAEQVEERCREIRNASSERSVGAAWRAWEHRSLTVGRDPVRGMLTITVEVPIEDGEVIVNAIDRVAETGDAATGLEFAATRALRSVRDAAEDVPAANGWRAQRADALLAIAKDSLVSTGSGAAVSAADHHQIVVHVDESALRGGIGRSDLPIDTVKRLACDGSVLEVVEDERGRVLDVGRKQRTVSTPLKRALWSRDRGCTFPGCRNRHFVDAHHIRHWADGGETSLENLTLLCSHHHRALHEGRFKIRRDADGALYFLRADGRAIPRAGYRLDDVLDDMVDQETVTREPSAEGFEPGAYQGNPSAEGLTIAAHDGCPLNEVRENAGVYLIQRRASVMEIGGSL